MCVYVCLSFWSVSVCVCVCVSQFLVGRLCGNGVSSYMELCDETGSIPLLVCIPYSPEPHPDTHTANPWLSDMREGSRVVVTKFSVIVEKTEHSENAKDTNLLFYLHPLSLKVMNVDQTQVDHIPSDSSTLYVLIKTKNCMKVMERGSKCMFEALGVTSSNLAELQSNVTTCNSSITPVTTVLEFTSAKLYSYVHNNCIYCVKFPKDQLSILQPSTDASSTVHRITVSDTVQLELVGLPQSSCLTNPTLCGSGERILEVGEVMSKCYLPKLQTAYATTPDER